MNKKYISINDKNVTKYISKGITEDLKTNTRFKLYARDGIDPNSPLARSQLIVARKVKIVSFKNNIEKYKNIAKLVIDSNVAGKKPVITEFNQHVSKQFSYYLVDRKSNIIITALVGVINKWVDLMVKSININGDRFIKEFQKIADLNNITRHGLTILILQAAGLVEVNLKEVQNE